MHEGDVLLVDDDEVGLRLFEQTLAYHGISCVTARSGSEAVARMKTWRVRSVVCDLYMDGMDGIDVLRWSRQGDRPPLPFAIVTTDLCVADELIGEIERHGALFRAGLLFQEDLLELVALLLSKSGPLHGMANAGGDAFARSAPRAFHRVTKSGLRRGEPRGR